MEYRRFVDHVQQLVPAFILKPFAHLLKAIPEQLRNDFITRVRQYNDISRALDWLAFSAGVKNQPIMEYAHQRMQDNMSEIMD